MFLMLFNVFTDLCAPCLLANFFPLLLLPDILQGNFKPDYYLKHIQKDLRLAISMGDMANHPTPMAAAANEVQLCAFIIFSGVNFSFLCVCSFYAFILGILYFY